MLGLTIEKGLSLSFAKLNNDGRCLPKISNQKWKLWDGSNSNAAGNNVKVRCGYKPKGINNNILYTQRTKNNLFLHFSTHF